MNVNAAIPPPPPKRIIAGLLNVKFKTVKIWLTIELYTAFLGGGGGGGYVMVMKTRPDVTIVKESECVKITVTWREIDAVDLKGEQSTDVNIK